MEEFFNQIRVLPGGKLYSKNKEYRCALGRNGIAVDKKEGDGATPAGTYPIRKLFYRSDRVQIPKNIKLPAQEILPDDAWCDDINDPAYNTHVKLPHPGSYENLYRDDEIYDLIVVIGYNDNPPIAGKGSAIFIHVARTDYSPTAGCIALAKADLLEIIKDLTPETKIKIG
jgi:L,D-peptidoglycan transpeptidase YkuD (ErfK/YbiS/YcfS/YnhG family)